MTDAQIGILVTITITAIGWALLYRNALKKEGAQEAQHEENRKRITDIEKVLSEKVASTLFKEEIADLHGRISRMQKESADAMKEQGAKIDRMTSSTDKLTGMMQMWATMKGLPTETHHE